MSKIMVMDPPFVGEFYECDLCKTGYLTRVVTDSYTGLDICFDCASLPTSHGLFWTITQDPEQDEGDNLMVEAAKHGLLKAEDDDLLTT